MVDCSNFNCPDYFDLEDLKWESWRMNEHNENQDIIIMEQGDQKRLRMKSYDFDDY